MEVKPSHPIKPSLHKILHKDSSFYDAIVSITTIEFDFNILII